MTYKSSLTIIICFAFLHFILPAQVAINTDNSNPDPSAMLDVKSIDKGILVPRMNTAQRTLISNPANGLLVFDSQTESFWFYSSGAWSELKTATGEHQIKDFDGNTKVDVESNPNEDKIRFHVDGKEIGVLDSTRFDLVFPDSSTIIGHLAGNENAIISYPEEDDQGKFNTFFGLKSGYLNNPDPGTCNSYDPWNIYENGCGAHNTFLGNKSGMSNTFGRHNLFVGSRAGLNNEGESDFSAGNGGSGSENTFLGFMSGQFNKNGFWNTFVGAYSGEENGKGTTNYFDEGSYNTYLGVFAGRFNKSGKFNTYVGTQAGGGWDNDSGERNVYLGAKAGYGNTGVDNVYVGTDAGFNYSGDINPGNRNTFVGNEAGYNHEGSNNVFIGYRAGYDETESDKLYIANDDTDSPLIYGDFAVSIAVINGKLGIGDSSPLAALTVGDGDKFLVDGVDGDIILTDDQGSLRFANTTGTNSPMIELFSGGTSNDPRMFVAHSPAYNNWGIKYDDATDAFTWIGNDIPALHVNLAGTQNIGIGTNTPSSKLEVAGNTSITNSEGDIDLLLNSQEGGESRLKLFEGTGYGFEFEYDGATNVDKLYLWSRKFSGNEAVRMTWLKNGFVGIGTSSPTARLEVNASIVKKVGGGTWTASSDRRLKKDISDYREGLEEILAIRPVNFRYNKTSGYNTDEEHIGVIAQELEKIVPHMVSSYKKDGEEYLQVDNSAMTYMLINAVKELHNENLHLEEENAQMKSDIAQIKSLLEMHAEKK